MKKFIAIIGLLLFSSTSVFAAADNGVATSEGLTLKAVTPAALDIGKASKGVKYGWRTSSTGYAINTYHGSGTKIFGSAYDSTALYFKDVGVGATFAQPTSSATAEAFGTGWTKM